MSDVSDITQKLDHILRTSISNTAFQPANERAAILRTFIGRIIVLDGIPCSGKTHLGRTLRDYFTENGIAAIFLEEKINKQHLGRFYAAMKRGESPNPHSFPLQLCAMHECIQIYKEAVWYAGRGPGGGKPHVVIIDRPIWGNRVFEQLQVAKGNITQEEHEIYDSYIVKHGPYLFDHLVYLYTSPEKAHHRVLHVRKHTEEADMPLEYLWELQRTYFIHIHKHVVQGDRALCVIANDDAYVSAEGVIDTLLKHRMPPKIKRSSEDLIRTKEVSTVFADWCDHYAQ